MSITYSRQPNKCRYCTLTLLTHFSARQSERSVNPGIEAPCCCSWDNITIQFLNRLNLYLSKGGWLTLQRNRTGLTAPETTFSLPRSNIQPLWSQSGTEFSFFSSCSLWSETKKSHFGEFAQTSMCRRRHFYSKISLALWNNFVAKRKKQVNVNIKQPDTSHSNLLSMKKGPACSGVQDRLW